ncbi:MAG: glycosyl transferase family 2 [Opitutia bacterium]|nr:glycosyltransferase [Opitutaceae bacterium]PHX71125.1 MAG: glycosyl transferase family 2 [Opitutae bacterium]
MTPTPRYSLVVPFYNEAGNISPLIATAVEVLDTLPYNYEIILVNDGSTDATAVEISACITQWPQCRALHQPRNLGQATALLDGLRSARGEILLAMDGDGQNDPRDFPLLLAPVEAGTLDVACGWRHDRHDSWLRRRMSRLANLVRGRVLGDHLHDSGCQLRAMRREVVACLFPFELLQSFLPAIVVAAGFRLGEFRVRHHPRTRGEAKYGLRQLWLRPTLAMFRLRSRLRARS